MKRNLTILAILISILAVLMIFRGPESEAANFSPELGRAYSRATDVCMILKIEESIPLATYACPIGAGAMGAADTQFDITQPYASNTDIARVTYDGTGTDPEWDADNPGVGSIVEINCQNFNANNNGFFLTTTSATDYIEFTNALNVVESNVTIGTGSFSSRIWEVALGISISVASISTAQFDITNPSGNTFRYTYDGTGTNPGINVSTIKIGDRLHIASPNFNLANCGFFTVTASGDNYFEVTNAAGVAESNVTLGNGYIKNRGIL